MDTVLREMRYPTVVFGQALLIIAIVWVIIGSLRLRRMAARRAVVLSLAEATLAASLAAIWAFTIVPTRIPLPGDGPVELIPNLIPVVPVLEGLASVEADITAFNAVGNVLLFAPLGAALVWRFGLGPKHVLAIAVVGSVVIEAYQSVAGLGRSVDVNDVLLNSIGAVIGALAMRWALSHAEALRIEPPTRDASRAPS